MATTDGQSVKERVQEERTRRRQDARIEQVRKRAKHERTITEFQPDAVEIEHRKVPGGARWTLYVVVAFICTFVLWSYWAKVDKIVVGNGKLITTENAVVVQSFSAAPIHSLHARFGDRVKAGQLVATLDPTFSDADLIQLNGRKNAAMATLARLKAELDGEEFSVAGHEGDREWETQALLYRERKREFLSELEKFDAELTKLNVQIENTKNEITFQETRVPIFKNIFEKQSELKRKGNASVVDFESARLNFKNAEKELATARNLIKELEADLLFKNKESASFVAGSRSTTADEYSKSNQELGAVEQEINKANRMNELLNLTVPTDSGHDEFVVFEVAERSVGSILKEGEPLFKLIPIDVPLEAEVEIAGRDVAELRALSGIPKDGKWPNGSKVTIKLGAFDYQDHGTLSGYVRAVSEGVFEKADQQGASSANFKARIKLIEPVKLEKVPEDMRLMPGMSATAEIKVGNRRVIDYFLYPILRYLDEGFRER